MSGVRLLALVAICAIALAGDLHEAAGEGAYSQVSELLAAGADVNSIDETGNTALHRAAWNGDARIVELLLARGAAIDPPHPETGSTPLHHAVITNQIAAAKLLLERGAKVRATTKTGFTALHFSAGRGYAKMTELLLDHGAEVDARSQGGSTPLIEAAWWGRVEVATILLGRGAAVGQRGQPGNVTPLHAASVKGHADMVWLLLRSGADAGAVDDSGERPLDQALRFKHVETVAALLEFNGNRQDSAVISKLLQEAIIRGQAETVRILLRRPLPEINALLPNGSTLLHEAALKGHLEIAQLLLGAGADPNGKSATGATPLHDAATGGALPVLELLLAKGADVNAKDTQLGGTPLHQAASWGRIDAVRLLLTRGADPSARNGRGLRPSEAAIENQHPKAADLIQRTYAARQTP